MVSTDKNTDIQLLIIPEVSTKPGFSFFLKKFNLWLVLSQPEDKAGLTSQLQVYNLNKELICCLDVFLQTGQPR